MAVFVPSCLATPASECAGEHVAREARAMPGVLSKLLGGVSPPTRRMLGYLGAMAAVGAAIRAAGGAAADTPSALPGREREGDDDTPVAAAARARRPGVDAHFIKQLVKLLGICIPSVLSAEAAWAAIAGGV